MKLDVVVCRELAREAVREQSIVSTMRWAMIGSAPSRQHIGVAQV